MGASYAERVIGLLAAHDAVMAVLDDPRSSVLQHVSQHTTDGEVRLDACPCPRDVEGLPVDDIGRPVLVQLGEGQYISSVRHTLADLVRDVTGA
jgi:hypothetical protein